MLLATTLVLALLCLVLLIINHIQAEKNIDEYWSGYIDGVTDVRDNEVKVTVKEYDKHD